MTLKIPCLRMVSAKKPAKAAQSGSCRQARSRKRSRASAMSLQQPAFARLNASMKATTRGGARRTDAALSMRGTKRSCASPQLSTQCQSAFMMNGSFGENWKPHCLQRPLITGGRAPGAKGCRVERSQSGHGSKGSAKGPLGSSRTYVSNSSALADRKATGGRSPAMVAPQSTGRAGSRCSKRTMLAASNGSSAAAPVAQLRLAAVAVAPAARCASRHVGMAAPEGACSVVA
mmetsp:Transcript_54359/g.174300  ORF Transcript_54359/g.174300 Transcript_54359/m.174300 type:complete len:232 (-) Transcript_54359:7-702(-)